MSKLGLRFAAACALASVVSPLHAQRHKAAELTLPTSWSAGEKYRLEITRERTRSVEGKDPQTTSTRYIVFVEIKERNEHGDVFAWRFGPDALNATEMNLPPELRGVLPSELELVFQTDAVGTPTSVLNLDEMVVFFKTAMRGMQEYVAKQGMDLSSIKTVLNQMADPQFVQSQLLREPGIFHLACGASLVEGRRVEYDDLLPNPLGSDPLPSKGYFLLASVTPDKREAAIEWGQRLDPNKAREFVVGFVRRLIPDATAADFDKQVAKMELTIDDKATYLFDTRSGWPKTAEYQRVVRVLDQGGRTDRWTFKVLPDGVQ